MKIIYASGPDHEVSSKDGGTQRSTALDQWDGDSLWGKSHSIRDDEAWPLQTNGQAPGLSAAARGAVAGVLLGASLWGAILVLAGFIKL
jgi:hypothetical protein